MKWNFPTKSSYTNSYPQRLDFTLEVKICSTIIILSHPSKYLQTSILKSYYIFQLCENLTQTLLDATLKGFKIPRFISNNKISEAILTILALPHLIREQIFQNFNPYWPMLYGDLAHLEYSSLFLELTRTKSLVLINKIL